MSKKKKRRLKRSIGASEEKFYTKGKQSGNYHLGCHIEYYYVSDYSRNAFAVISASVSCDNDIDGESSSYFHFTSVSPEEITFEGTVYYTHSETWYELEPSPAYTVAFPVSGRVDEISADIYW